MRDRLRALLARLTGWFTPGRVEREFDDELAHHLDELIADYTRRGLPPDEAARAARVSLGGVAQLRETHRAQHGLPFADAAWQDTRFAWRMLRRNPGFTAVATLTLALGVGANTAIFSVVRAALLAPLPCAEPERVVTLYQQSARDASVQTGWSFTNFTALTDHTSAFEALAGSQHHQLTLTGHGDPTLVNTSVVTSAFFDVYGVPPLLGRALTTEDGKRGAAAVVVLGETLWRHSFGADPSVIGTAIDLDQRAFTVVGIMPASFRFPVLTQAEQLWVPLPQDPLFGDWMTRRGGHWLQVTARLRPGLTMAAAETAVGALSGELARDEPAENRDWTVGMMRLRDLIVGDVQPALLVLFGAVGLVLLIACTNIANLLLARAASRTREMAVRATLGAGRGRLVRQLLCETAVLGVLGGVAGILLATWGVGQLRAFLPASMPQVQAVGVDRVVLAFALVVSIGASLLFGLAPAVFTARQDLHARLRDGDGRAGESRQRRRTRSALAATETALAMVLLTSAGLLLQSFARLTAVAPGFDADALVTAEISLPRFAYATPDRWTAFGDALLDSVRAEPGLQETAIGIPRPIADRYVNLGFVVSGRPPINSYDGATQTADFAAVSPNYFSVMHIPLEAGRRFDDADRPEAPRVAIITRAMAERYFPHENPLGQELAFGLPPDSAGPRRIVGVVGDIHDVSLAAAPGPMMYVPFAQSPLAGACLVTRSSLAAPVVADAIRRAVSRVDKSLPVTDVATMPHAISASVAESRFQTTLLAMFAGVALVMAATGIFGVISYSVSCRTREIGIRVALGASRAGLFGMVLRETLTLALTGFAIGLVGSLAAAGLIQHLLFGVSARDPMTLGVVVAALTLVALLAAYVPARRTMNVDPVRALNHD